MISSSPEPALRPCRRRRFKLRRSRGLGLGGRGDSASASAEGSALAAAGGSDSTAARDPTFARAAVVAAWGGCRACVLHAQDHVADLQGRAFGGLDAGDFAPTGDGMANTALSVSSSMSDWSTSTRSPTATRALITCPG